MSSGDRRSTRHSSKPTFRRSLSEKLSEPLPAPSNVKTRKRAASQLPKSLPVAKKQKLAPSASHSGKAGKAKSAGENSSVSQVEVMDTDEGSPPSSSLRSSKPIAVKGGGRGGNKNENEESTARDASAEQEQEFLEAKLFGEAEEEDGVTLKKKESATMPKKAKKAAAPKGGLFDDDEEETEATEEEKKKPLLTEQDALGEGHDDDDENEEDDDQGASGLALGSAGLAANTRRLADMMMGGGGFNPLLGGGGGGGRWKEYLAGLQSPDEMLQMDALINLADELCVMTEETAHGFRLDSFLPPLVIMLSSIDNPNMILLSCRCMSHILEALPGSENAFVRHDAVPGLVDKLLNIEYDDMRDLAMGILSRLCQSPLSAGNVLKNGGLVAVLTNLDFCAINSQVTAVTCAANMLRSITADSWPQIRDALPTIALLLQYEDLRLVEKSTMCLASICTYYLSDPPKLEEIVSSGALSNLVRLITERSEKGLELSNLTWMVVRCLATLCRGLPRITETLISTGLHIILKNMLLQERENATKGMRTSAKTNTQAVYDMVALADQLFPPLPAEVATYLKSASVPQVSGVVGRLRGLQASGQAAEIDLLSSGSIPIPADASQPDHRTVLYQKHPNTLLTVAEALLGTMTLVFGSRVNLQLRSKCLSTITKIIYTCTPEMLATLLKDLTFSSFLASLLASKELKFIAVALSIAENLMTKLPDIFSAFFTREGVVHEVEQLIANGAQFKSASRTATAPSTPSGAPPMPVVGTPSEGNVFPITPTAPSFMWEALASPPTPSAMKKPAKAKSAAAAASPSGPISFGSSPPKTPIAATTAPAADTGSPASTSQESASNENSNDSTASAQNAAEALRLEVVEKCIQFKKKYFAVDGTTSEGLDQLSKLATDLQSALWTEKDAKNVRTHLESIASVFLSGISTHEFVHSSLPTALFQLLTLKDTETHIPRRERLDMFLHIFGKASQCKTPSSTPSTSDGVNGPAKMTSAWLQLVRELQNATEKNDNFVVKLNPAFLGSGNANGLGGVKANAIAEFLTKAFAVKLVRDPSEKSLPLINEGPVSVEPLATGRAIKDFIWAKINNAIVNESKRAAEAAKKAAAEEAARVAREHAKANPVASRTRSKGNLKSSSDDASSSTSSPGKVNKGTATPSKSATSSSSSSSPRTSVALTKSAEKPVEEAKPAVEQYQPPEDDDQRLTEGEEDLAAIDDENDMEQGMIVDEVDENARPEADSPPPQEQSTAMNANSLVLKLDGVAMTDSCSFFKVVRDKAIEVALSNNPAEAHNEVSTPLAPMWSQTHTVYYRLQDASESKAAQPSSPRQKAPVFANTVESLLRPDSVSVSLDRTMEALMQGDVAATCSFDQTLVLLLTLLKILYELNRDLHKLVPLAAAEHILAIPPSEFINAKLTAKLARQLQDPLALCTNTLPSWCASLATDMAFLFPLDLRQLFFRGSSLGVPRALIALKDRVDGVLEGNFGRITPHKVRIDRHSIRHLNSAFVVLQHIRQDSRSMLEVEYANEVATGAGPTLEFYTLVSHAFQQTSLGMWVSAGNDKVIRHQSPNAMQVDEPADKTGEKQVDELTIVNNNGGLFPVPLIGKDATDKNAIRRFSFLGTFIAKAIMDDRLIDMPFSSAFIKGLLGVPLHLDDLKPVYPHLIDILKEFQALIAEKKAIEEDKKMNAVEKKKRVAGLKYRGGAVEDMWLTFELPGTNVELVPDGANKAVTIQNLEEWVALVVDAIAGKGVRAQFEALQTGFAHIFDVARLAVFSSDELEVLMCGSGSEQDWSKEAILEAANYTHGFSSSSRVSGWFATLLSQFDEEWRRKFLRFATGAPRLPPRGFKGFHHRLTLSRKDASVFSKVDDVYPSVSTCFLFIKIPDYSSFDIFRERFLTAIENGQSGFGLS